MDFINIQLNEIEALIILLMVFTVGMIIGYYIKR